ncbi:helix-turn-helix domain-containing protein [Streptomyces puniciscabiei]
MRPMDPALQRRRLRDRLRRLREAIGYTQREVAEAMEWSPSKVIRIESGSVGISVSDCRILLQHYGVDPAEAEEIVSMARDAKARPWWERFRNTVSSQPFLTYLSYEGHAQILRGYSPLRVPGLLQTEEYMHEIFQNAGVAESDASLRAELRVERQERMFRSDGPKLHFIIDESVIRRPVRTKTTMRRQLTHLKELVDRPNVTIRVMKFSDGMYPMFSVPYLILEFDSSEQDLVLYLEEKSTVREGSSEGSMDDTSPSHYLEIFFGLEQIAPTERTVDLIDNAIRDFS